MPTRDPQAAASARHSAPWAVVLLVLGAMVLAAGVVMRSVAVAVAGGAVLVGGTLLLGWTSLRGGRGDEPRMPARFP